ncbi:MAG: TRAP transporter small permease subunit [Pseudolabrys sp.]|nr:TRAP transporter small permease subunit [Pseudolabrys sp.]
MEKIERACKASAQVLATIGLGTLLCFAVSTIADGMLRFFFASPLDFVRDVGGLVAAFAVATCIPVAIIERSNITIRFLSGLFGPRISRIADLGAGLLVEVILLLMTWQFVLFAQQANETGTATWMLRIPTTPVWAMIAAILAFSAAMQAIVTLQVWSSRPDQHADRAT